MSHRRPDPRQAGLENVLRNALRLAADSVEPAADGLDRIRAKISTRQPVSSGWATSTPAGVLGSLWRWLEPAIIWLRYMAGAVVERFRPDPDRPGRLGWLRPAAALATGIFVVAAASWLITALPAVITPANDSGGFNGGPGGGGSSAPSASHSNGVQSTTGASLGSGGPGTATPTRTCGPSSPAPSSSPTTSPTTSPSPSPSPSQSSSPSPSPSPSPSGSGGGTPTPSGSPSASVPTTSPGASAAGAAGAAATGSGAPSDAASSGSRTSSGPGGLVMSSPAPRATPQRCG